MGLLSLAALLPTLALGQIISPGDLSRAHEELDTLRGCSKCHETSRRLSAQTCLSCHTALDARVAKGKGFHGRLPAAERETCQSCHHEHQGKDFALIDWTPQKFDHTKAGYTLRGKHASAECKACHTAAKMVDEDAKKLAEHPKAHTYLGLGTACVSCHQDTHVGKLGQQCQTCHDETSWKVRAGFDHDKTTFALSGKHERVACVECHATKAQGVLDPAFPPVPHASCTACHADPHQKRFGQRCESCHTTASWHALKKDAAERSFHSKTRFPLEGAHQDVACAACHGPFHRGQAAKFKGLPFQHCSACHLDAHGAQLAAKSQCEQCHTTQGFSPASYDLATHTSFPLEDAHAAVGCGECHRANFRDKRPPAPGNGKVFTASKIDFHPAHGACVTCHKDPHGGQFAAKTCDHCHTTRSFSALRFDHETDTSFPLTGAHATAACAGCHTAVKANEPVRYRGAPATCAACHADVHYGQLSGGCERCHETTRFVDTVFDHAKTRFVLEGKHARIRCEACHPKVEVKPGVSVQRFADTPRVCSGCHKDPHHGAFKRFKP